MGQSGQDSTLDPPIDSLRIGVIETYNQIADHNLHDLRRQTSPPRKNLLQHMNQEVSQRRADESAIDRHFWHTRVDIVAMFADVLGDPRRNEFL